MNTIEEIANVSANNALDRIRNQIGKNLAKLARALHAVRQFTVPSATQEELYEQLWDCKSNNVDRYEIEMIIEQSIKKMIQNWN